MWGEGQGPEVSALPPTPLPTRISGQGNGACGPTFPGGRKKCRAALPAKNSLVAQAFQPVKKWRARSAENGPQIARRRRPAAATFDEIAHLLLFADPSKLRTQEEVLALYPRFAPVGLEEVDLAGASGREDYVRVRLREAGETLWADPVLGPSGLLSPWSRATAWR